MNMKSKENVKKNFALRNGKPIHLSALGIFDWMIFDFLLELVFSVYQKINLNESQVVLHVLEIASIACRIFKFYVSQKYHMHFVV